MNLNNDDIQEIRQKDMQHLSDVLRKSDDIKGNFLDEIEKEHDGYISQIKGLIEEKENLLRSPSSKPELTALAKENLRKCKAEIYQIIKQHLVDCQTGHSSPFYQLAMKNMFAEDKSYRLLWLFLQDQDIDAIIADIEEIGIPSDERDRKISDINKQIEKLSAKLTKK